MKTKQEQRGPAKQQQQPHPLAGKGRTPKVVAKSSANTAAASASAAASSSAFDDVANLFNAIKQTKAHKAGPPASAASAPETTGAGGRRQGKTDSGRGARTSAAEGKPVRDGLYHAPQKSVQMSDDLFFSGTWLKADQATASGSAVVVASSGGNAESAETSQELLRQEGVDRIVSMEELSKMLSRNAKAGTTPNCPFDCDCCF